MKLANAVMMLAGVMTLLFTLLSMFVHGAFIYGTLFVGFMLIQSSITGFCPASYVLKALGVKE